MTFFQARSIVEELVAPYNRDFFEFIEHYNGNKSRYSAEEQSAVAIFEQRIFNPAN